VFSVLDKASTSCAKVHQSNKNKKVGRLSQQTWTKMQLYVDSLERGFETPQLGNILLDLARTGKFSDADKIPSRTRIYDRVKRYVSKHSLSSLLEKRSFGKTGARSGICAWTMPLFSSILNGTSQQRRKKSWLSGSRWPHQALS
jgi:hypothetical protein